MILPEFLRLSGTHYEKMECGNVECGTRLMWTWDVGRGTWDATTCTSTEKQPNPAKPEPKHVLRALPQSRERHALTIKEYSVVGRASRRGRVCDRTKAEIFRKHNGI